MGELLVLKLFELHSGCLSTSTGLEPGKDGANLVLTDLLHITCNSGSEKDFGVSKTEFLLVQFDDIHHGPGRSLGGDDVVASLELGVGQFVGEASSADGDTGQ